MDVFLVDFGSRDFLGDGFFAAEIDVFFVAFGREDFIGAAFLAEEVCCQLWGEISSSRSSFGSVDVFFVDFDGEDVLAGFYFGIGRSCLLCQLWCCIFLLRWWW
jgi:hypothetical protein